jgi:hypothetical protein
VASIEHQADKPSWDCGSGGRPWPCDPARERLRAEGAGTPLAVLMSMYLEEAVAELPAAPPGEIFDWFIAWTRPVPLG